MGPRRTRKGQAEAGEEKNGRAQIVLLLLLLRLLLLGDLARFHDVRNSGEGKRVIPVA